MNTLYTIPANVETVTFTATHYGKHGNVKTHVVLSLEQDANDGLFDLNVGTIKAGKSRIYTYGFPTRKAALAELKRQAIRYTFIQSVANVTFTTKD
jgi:hypothetical protein